MAIYRCKLYANLYNRQLLNVFWYEGAAGGVATDVANAFIADVLPDIRNVQTDDVVYDRIVVEELNDVADFAEVSIVSSGAIVGTALPAFIALGFRLNRTTRLTRHGQKRFAGIAESDIENESVVGTTNTNIPALETALAQVISLAGGDYQPVIMERVLNEVTQVYEISGNTNNVASAQFTGVTTQNTRKA